MTEESLRSVSLFFFFAFMEDGLAVPAAQQAHRVLKQNSSHENSRSASIRLVQVTAEILEKVGRHRPPSALTEDPVGWRLPEGMAWQPWREFHRQATEEELPILIWCMILGIPEREVAVAIGLPEGTIRHRLGRGLRKLGGLL